MPSDRSPASPPAVPALHASPTRSSVRARRLTPRCTFLHSQPRICPAQGILYRLEMVVAELADGAPCRIRIGVVAVASDILGGRIGLLSDAVPSSSTRNAE